MVKKTDDPFDIYRLPAGVTDGVDIPLPGTPAMFRVRLPSAANDDYNMAFMSKINANRFLGEGFDPTGDEVDAEALAQKLGGSIDPAEVIAMRRELFRDKCIVSAAGLPEGMDVASFFKTYPLALRRLHDRAEELARQADREFNEAMGNLSDTSSGSSTGKGAKRLSTSSSPVALASARPGPSSAH